MKVLRILFMCAIALIATSCGTVSNNSPYKFDQVRLEMGMQDLEYLGETEVSVEYTKYLGFISSIQKVNGETYDPSHKTKLDIPGNNLFAEGKLSLAAYKLVEKYPSAVYFQVVFETKNTEKLFLGSSNKVTAKVRAYNLRKYQHSKK